MVLRDIECLCRPGGRCCAVVGELCDLLPNTQAEVGLGRLAAQGPELFRVLILRQVSDERLGGKTDRQVVKQHRVALLSVCYFTAWAFFLNVNFFAGAFATSSFAGSFLAASGSGPRSFAPTSIARSRHAAR